MISRICRVFSKVPVRKFNSSLDALKGFAPRIENGVLLSNKQYQGFSTKSNWEEYIDDSANVGQIFEEQNIFKTGSLIICPTPIGNLEDLSIRQYQALMHADIIICEDLKTTSITLHLAKNKRTTESVAKIVSESYESNSASIIYEGEEINGENDLSLLELGEIKETQFQSGRTYTEVVRQRIQELRSLEKSLLKESGRPHNVLEGDYLEDIEGNQEEGFRIGSSNDIEEAFIQFIRSKIIWSKKYRGRGILFENKKGSIVKQIDQIIRLIQLGFHVVLISKAGTPCVADPSYQIVDRCLKEHIKIEALPGAASMIVAMSKSGYPADRFEFIGNISSGRAERESQLSWIRESETTAVAFQQADQLMKTFLTIEKIFGERQQIFLSFDMTKEDEKYYRGEVRELYESFSDPEKQKQFELKGELTLVIPPFTPTYNKGLVDADHAKRRRKYYHMEWESEKNKQEIPIEPRELALTLANNLDATNENIAEIMSSILRIPRNRALSLLEFAKLNEKKEPTWDNFIDSETLKEFSKGKKGKKNKNKQ